MGLKLAEFWLGLPEVHCCSNGLCNQEGCLLFLSVQLPLLACANPHGSLIREAKVATPPPYISKCVCVCVYMF